jgi:hypothetical protein
VGRAVEAIVPIVDTDEAKRLLVQAEAAIDWILKMPDEDWYALPPEVAEDYCKRLNHWSQVAANVTRRRLPPPPS